MPVPTGDFQDLPAWRRLTVETARLVAGVGTAEPADLVVAMTLTDPGYRCEIHTGLEAAGLRLDEFALIADRETVAARIGSD